MLDNQNQNKNQKNDSITKITLRERTNFVLPSRFKKRMIKSKSKPESVKLKKRKISRLYVYFHKSKFPTFANLIK